MERKIVGQKINQIKHYLTLPNQLYTDQRIHNPTRVGKVNFAEQYRFHQQTKTFFFNPCVYTSRYIHLYNYSDKVLYSRCMFWNLIPFSYFYSLPSMFVSVTAEQHVPVSVSISPRFFFFFPSNNIFFAFATKNFLWKTSFWLRLLLTYNKILVNE